MSKETVIITWNFTNWITVILMALLGWTIYRAVKAFATREYAAE